MSNLSKNQLLAFDIKDFLLENNINTDTRIYFNNMAYDSNEDGYELLENIKGSAYNEYTNDETVSMTFEGELYYMINYGVFNLLLNEFNAIFEKHKCYYELGDAWNLSVYFD
jgi:hypothetical protein